MKRIRKRVNDVDRRKIDKGTHRVVSSAMMSSVKVSNPIVAPVKIYAVKLRRVAGQIHKASGI